VIETPQDREDRIVQRVLAFATVAIVAFVVVILMFKEIPNKNEVMIGTVIGFIFGNMAGPIFRKIFGGPDSGTRQAVAASNDVLKTAVAAASGVQGNPVVVQAPAVVTVEPNPKPEE